MTTLIIMLLGVATVVLSVYAAIIFASVSPHRNAQKVSMAISWQLVGEAIIGLGTLAFAMAAHFGWLTEWPQTLQSSIRFTMFFATSATTFHLVRTVHKLKE